MTRRPHSALILLTASLAAVLVAVWNVPSAPPPAQRPVVQLADDLRLAWSRELPPQSPAWPDQAKLQFDAVAPLAADDQSVYVASARRDGVTAYDADTGLERWHFQADAPVRFAPLPWQDRLFLVSDDGYLYCLNSDSGDVLWKFRGSLGARRVLGNERLISAWPARGAPALAVEPDGRATVYFAAGIWPFMGVEQARQTPLARSVHQPRDR